MSSHATSGALAPTRTPRRHAVVLAGGERVEPPLPRPLAPPDLVVAADSGLAAAQALGLDVDLLVGDLDSVAPAQLAAAEAAGVPVARHPAAKDHTDLALALDAALAADATHVTVVGGAGGRLDHLLGGLLLLAADAYAAVRITALVGEAVVTVVRDAATLRGAVGELVSLLPAHGHAAGVTTEGLRFPLSDDELHAGSTRGVSNELTGPRAHVRVRRGVLLVVQPGSPTPLPLGG